MAVLLIKGHPPRYIGTSGDEKPAIDSEALLEAEFIETDTKLTYVYTADNQWVEKTSTFIPSRQYIWNPNTLEWEASEGTVTISGTVAVTGAFYQATQPVSIASMPSTPVTGTFYQATQPVSISSMPSTPVTGTFFQATQPVSGSVSIVNPSTAAVASVESSDSSVTLQASNANRVGIMIFNNSTAALYVKFGTTASAADFTVKIAAGGYFEAPSPCYTGKIDGIWAAVNGAALVTEITT